MRSRLETEQKVSLDEAFFRKLSPEEILTARTAVWLILAIRHLNTKFGELCGVILPPNEFLFISQSNGSHFAVFFLGQLLWDSSIDPFEVEPKETAMSRFMDMITTRLDDIFKQWLEDDKAKAQASPVVSEEAHGVIDSA